MTLAQFTELIRSEYGADPEYLWESTPDAGAFRHRSSRKWFAVFMRVRRSRLGLEGDELIDIADLKCDPLMLGSVLLQEGVLPGYHMNKSYWITVLLDGSVPAETIVPLLEMSYELTKTKKHR
ncbi:MAG: MmcQ/YjbR family DNA-binding protein [Ruminococcus sp.]|nr:MmcQ/YjbR family DNA-binding protein [Ruminococcus sp.]